MKRTAKLQLFRETLRALETAELAGLAGGEKLTVVACVSRGCTDVSVCRACVYPPTTTNYSRYPDC